MSTPRHRIARDQAVQHMPRGEQTGFELPEPGLGELVRAVPILVLFLLFGMVWLVFGPSIMRQP